MKKHSCGAILYTIINHKIHIVLGMEKQQWFPFKGTREKGETNEETAIREIYEETCGIIKLRKINLKCNFSTKRKHYHIGLIYVKPDIIEKFHTNRKNILENVDPLNNDYISFIEKTDIKMFPLSCVKYKNFHYVTITPIDYYYRTLKNIEINNILKANKPTILKQEILKK